MTIASLLEVRLVDGRTPPVGAPARLLIALDGGLTARPEKRGRKHLLRALSELLERAPTDDELDAVLAPLVASGAVEDCGPYEPAYMNIPQLFPGMKVPRVREPTPYDSPQDGERCYRLTPAGHRTARLCLGLHNVFIGPPWLLGADRIDDQVVLAIGARQLATRLAIGLTCSNTPEPDIDAALARVVADGLADEGGAGEEGMRYAATLAGEVRHKALRTEVSAIAQRLFLEASGASVPPPVPLQLAPDRKLALLQSISEERLCREVIMPMLQAMGFFGVTYNNGPQERGKDIYCWRTDVTVRRWTS
jgi:hypothetical protein